MTVTCGGIRQQRRAAGGGELKQRKDRNQVVLEVAHTNRRKDGGTDSISVWLAANLQMATAVVQRSGKISEEAAVKAGKRGRR